MPKNITSVVWSASNLPSGLSFDTATGTFSGTPTTAGEYTVPVTVRTNYGEDTKNVVISVKNNYPVIVLSMGNEKFYVYRENDSTFYGANHSFVILSNSHVGRETTGFLPGVKKYEFVSEEDLLRAAYVNSKDELNDFPDTAQLLEDVVWEVSSSVDLTLFDEEGETWYTIDNYSLVSPVVTLSSYNGGLVSIDSIPIDRYEDILDYFENEVQGVSYYSKNNAPFVGLIGQIRAVSSMTNLYDRLKIKYCCYIDRRLV